MRPTVSGPIGCLLIPSLSLSSELAERPELRGLPVALGGGDAGPRVVDASPEALRYGIDPGISLREAIGLCPALVVAEPRPAAYERAFAAIVRTLQGASPLVERETLGVAYADLTGLEQLYGEGLADALLRCAPVELEPRVGIAAGRFTALAAARAAEPGRPLTWIPSASRESPKSPCRNLAQGSEALDRRLFVAVHGNLPPASQPALTGHPLRKEVDPWPGEDRERHDRGWGSERVSSGEYLIDTSGAEVEAQRAAASLISYLVVSRGHGQSGSGGHAGGPSRGRGNRPAAARIDELRSPGTPSARSCLRASGGRLLAPVRYISEE